MWTKDGRPTKTGLFAAVVLLAFSIDSRCRVSAQEVAYCSEEAGWPCPSPQPILETYPGWSLYWHDACEDAATCRPNCRHHPSTSPAWYATTEFLPLFRDPDGDIPFQTLGPDGDVVLGTGDFEAEFQGGLRVTIGHSLGDWYRLEGSWTTLNSWSDQAAIRNLDEYDLNGDGTLDPGTSGNLYSPFSGFGTPGTNPTGVVGLDFNRFALIQFSSDFDSVELNLRRRLRVPQRRHAMGQASVLIGFRYMNVKESFNYLTASEIPPVLGTANDVRVGTRNDLFGPQLGFTGQFLVHDRAWVDVELKGAVFANQTEQNTLYTNTNNVGVTRQYPGQARARRTSFMGDLSVVFNYQFAPAWTFRAGYNAIWLNGVALGAENFNPDVNILRLGPAAIDHKGRVVYHGPNVGLTWAR